MAIGLSKKFLEGEGSVTLLDGELTPIKGSITKHTEHYIVVENKILSHLIPWTAIADIAVSRKKEDLLKVEQGEIPT